MCPAPPTRTLRTPAPQRTRTKKQKRKPTFPRHRKGKSHLAQKQKRRLVEKSDRPSKRACGANKGQDSRSRAAVKVSKRIKKTSRMNAIGPWRAFLSVQRRVLGAQNMRSLSDECNSLCPDELDYYAELGRLITMSRRAGNKNEQSRRPCGSARMAMQHASFNVAARRRMEDRSGMIWILLGRWSNVSFVEFVGCRNPHSEYVVPANVFVLPNKS